MLRQLLQDARYAIRTLRGSRLFTAVALTCLVIGIAANTTMFSVFDAIVLRPLPFAHPEELVSLSERDPVAGRRRALSYAQFLELWRDGRAFDDLGAYSGRRVALTGGEEPELVAGELVSSSLLPMLGVRPQLGRPLTADDDRPGAPPVVLLSHALWRRRFGAERSAIGRVVDIDHQPYTLIGVMPPGFKFPEMSELWMPIGPAAVGPGYDVSHVSVIARLLPGGDAGRASAEFAVALRNLNARFPPADSRDTIWTGVVRPLSSGFVGSDERIAATAMLGATIFLLLIVCGNVGNLLLIRAVARRREFAVRLAMGASRERIAAQIITEGVILAGLGCVIALPITWWALGRIRTAIPMSDPYPYYVHWSLDWRTFLYAVTASLFSAALFGLAPMLHHSRTRLTDALKEGTHGAGTGVRANRARHLLVIGEVALALVLLVGSSLFLRAFLGLRRTDLGYDAGRIMTMRFFLPGERYDSARTRAQIVEEIGRRVEAVPGVSAATISDLIPLDDEGGSQDEVVIEGRPPDAATRAPVAYSGVFGDWFGTFGMRMLAGRAFTEQELRDSIPVAVVDRAMAERFWPDGGVIGGRFRLARDSAHTWFTVIGVAPVIRTMKLDENRSTPAEAYLPFRFVPTRDFGVIVRASTVPSAVTTGVRDAVHAADGILPVFNVWTMEEVRYLSFWMYAVWSALFASFGGAALALAAIGVYAVVYSGVAQRTHEIGVRVALGAQRADIIRLVLGRGMLLAGIGVATGMLGAVALTRVIGSLLIGVSATDPSSFVLVALLLGGIAALASYLPARRATRVDPLVALRAE